MIVKKFWFGKKKDRLGNRQRFCGWFLFGVIPLYIREVEG